MSKGFINNTCLNMSNSLTHLISDLYVFVENEAKTQAIKRARFSVPKFELLQSARFYEIEIYL